MKSTHSSPKLFVLPRIMGELCSPHLTLKCCDCHKWTMKNNPYSHCNISKNIFTVYYKDYKWKCLCNGIMLIQRFVCFYRVSLTKGKRRKSIIKMIFLTKQINKMTNIALYSDLKGK